MSSDSEESFDDDDEIRDEEEGEELSEESKESEESEDEDEDEEESDTDLSGFIVPDDQSSDSALENVGKKGQDDDDSGYYCHKCKKYIKGGLFHFRRHYRLVHVNVKKKFKCCFCERGYTTTAALKRHLDLHENMEKSKGEGKKKKKRGSRDGARFLDDQAKVVASKKKKKNDKNNKRKQKKEKDRPRKRSAQKRPRKRPAQKRPRKRPAQKITDYFDDDDDDGNNGRPPLKKKAKRIIIDSSGSNNDMEFSDSNRRADKGPKKKKKNEYMMGYRHGDREASNKSKKKKKKAPVVVITGPTLNDYQQGHDPFSSVPNDYTAADRALGNIEAGYNAGEEDEDEDEDAPGPSGTTRQQQRNWRPRQLSPGRNAGRSESSESGEVNEFVRGLRSETKSYVRPISSGFEINVRLDSRETITREFIRKALRIVNSYLRGQEATVRVEAGLLLRNDENGSLRYFYPGTDSSLLPVPFIVNDGTERGSMRNLFMTLSNTDINRVIMFRHYPESRWKVIRILGLRFVISFRGG